MFSWLYQNISKNEKILVFSFYSISEQNWRSFISYLEPTCKSGSKCTFTLKFTSTKMQYAMYPPTVFYYSFSQYTTYVSKLQQNEILIFSCFIAITYTLLALHLLPNALTLPWLDWTEMYTSYLYTPWILNLSKEYGKWTINVKLLKLICNTLPQHAYYTVIIATPKCSSLKANTLFILHF